MQKVIVIPNKYKRFLEYKERCHGKHLQLFYMIKEWLGFDIRFLSPNAQDFPINADITLLYGEPNALTFMPNVLRRLSKNTQLIGFFIDIHWYDLGFFPNLLDRCNAVLGISHEVFRRKYPDYFKKHIYFPHFFAPHYDYAELEFNDNPKRKCLLSGQTRSQYPIRSVVMERVSKDPALRKQIEILEHPRPDCKRFFTRENKAYWGYANILHEYFCCLTDDGAPENTQVAGKYFEIPATGSLLLAPIAPDLDQLDLIPGVHFVPIRKETVFSQIGDCLIHPRKYQKIRQDGMELVRKNHSINNRFFQLKEILESYT